MNSATKSNFEHTGSNSQEQIRQIRQMTGMGLLEAHVFFIEHGQAWRDKVSKIGERNKAPYDYREFHNQTVKIVNRFRSMSGSNELTGRDAELALVEIIKHL